MSREKTKSHKKHLQALSYFLETELDHHTHCFNKTEKWRTSIMYIAIEE